MAGFGGWQAQLLRRLGVPATRQNLQFLTAWQAHEGGSASFNPLNTTQGMPGATNYNSVGVRNYGSPDIGLAATVKTLRNGYYPGILAALRSGNPTWNPTLGKNLSTWGTGSSFMSGYRSQQVGGGDAAPPLSGVGGTAPQAAPAPGSTGPDLVRLRLLDSLRGERQIDWLSLARLAIQRRAAQAAPAQAVPAPDQTTRTPTLPYVPQGRASGRGLAEAFYDPLGSWDNGAFGGPIGHHMDHVHLSITNPQTMLQAIAYAQQHGLRVGENPYVDPVDPVHVKGSFHYRDFPGLYNKRKLGEAIDVSGNAKLMAAYYRWATGNLR